MERDQAMAVIERHQPRPLWRLLGLSHCARCPRRWPCPHYLAARDSLLRRNRRDVADTVHRNTRWSAS